MQQYTVTVSLPEVIQSVLDPARQRGTERAVNQAERRNLASMTMTS